MRELANISLMWARFVLLLLRSFNLMHLCTMRGLCTLTLPLTFITPLGFPVTGRTHEITPLRFVSMLASGGCLCDRAFIRGSAFTFLLSWTGCHRVRPRYRFSRSSAYRCSGGSSAGGRFL